MKTIVDRKSLARVVSTAAKATDKRSPMLAGTVLLVSWVDGVLRAEGRWTHQIAAWTEGQGPAAPWSVVVDAARLVATVKRAPKQGTVSLTPGRHGALLVEAGTWSATLQGLDRDALFASSLVRVDDSPLVVDALLEPLARVAHAVSTDREDMTGLNLLPGGVAMATDGHRQAVAPSPVVPMALSIPPDALKALALAAGGNWRQEEKHILASSGDVREGVAVAAMLYPRPFERLIEVDYSHRIEAVRADLLAAVERAAASSGHNRTIACRVENGGLVISARDEVSETREELLVVCETAPRYVLGVNADYMIDALRAAQGDDVAWEWGEDAMHPTRVSDAGGYYELVMPMGL